MPRYPHTRLFINPSHTVVLSGPHVQALDTQNGRILHSSASFSREDQVALIHSGPIRCSGTTRDGRYLATTGDDKRLKIWDLESLTLLSTRELPKKPTSIEFSRDTDVLVADKFGDVFRWTPPETAGGTLPTHETPPHGELILGHASLLTGCLLTPDEKFIITADRDEHIRVSWYPKGYVIESYCLGHKKYVSAIHIPLASPAKLISGGGDVELKVWDWMTGRLQQNITVFPAVEPFIKVKRRISACLELEGSEVQGIEGSQTTCDIVFVVHKISSFLASGENHIVFSVVGATAIFDFIMAETHNQPDIKHYDFGKPVIDFTVCGEGIIWVLLDADFSEESDASNEHPRKLVQIVQWSIDKFVDAGSSMLLDSLNTICSLPATAEDLQTLDLYSDLVTLPKSIDREQGSQGNEAEPTEGCPSGSVGLTKRALGRQKHKRALEKLHHEQLDSRDVPGRDAKKMKAGPDYEELNSMQYE
ncbi:WD40 repeat-like protein [Boletus edulis]|nr:WD40 repeat-like protein [Boletus edulis]